MPPTCAARHSNRCRPGVGVDAGLGGLLDRAEYTKTRWGQWTLPRRVAGTKQDEGFRQSAPPAVDDVCLALQRFFLARRDNLLSGRAEVLSWRAGPNNVIHHGRYAISGRVLKVPAAAATSRRRRRNLAVARARVSWPTAGKAARGRWYAETGLRPAPLGLTGRAAATREKEDERRVQRPHPDCLGHAVQCAWTGSPLACVRL